MKMNNSVNISQSFCPDRLVNNNWVKNWHHLLAKGLKIFVHFLVVCLVIQTGLNHQIVCKRVLIMMNLMWKCHSWKRKRHLCSVFFRWPKTIKMKMFHQLRICQTFKATTEGLSSGWSKNWMTLHLNNTDCFIIICRTEMMEYPT